VKHYLFLLETALEKQNEEKQDLLSKYENLKTTQKLYNINKELVETLQNQLHDIESERNLIKSKYEQLTQDFESCKNTLQDDSSITKEKLVTEAALQESLIKNENLKAVIEGLKGEVKDSKDFISCIEKEKESLLSDNVTLKQDMKHNSDLDNNREEAEKLKKKLNLALSNAKQLEAEYSELDSVLKAAEEEKNDLSESNAKLTKQISSLKAEIQTFNLEAEKSIKNPWEGEEWEGLTACEIYDMMKHDLVPAQQARLSKLCIEELEKQLEENKNILMRVLAEKAELVKVKTKLDAKVCFLENSSSEGLSDSNQSAKNSTLDDSEITFKTIENPKLKTEDSFQTPDTSRNLRRSSRSASKLASISLLKTPDHPPEDVKRSANTIGKEEDAEKRIKMKTTDTDSPAKVVKVPKKQNLIKPSKLAEKPAVEDRDPLSCVTNSPGKIKPSATKGVTKTDQKLGLSRGSSLRQDSMRGRKKNPEECKQQ